ncbi:hypothetical protein Hypma_008881 [Hypsizygus marmoreus]|uniref:Uncharacterized protein n=1 Tax=Hypsizygus marmoreus TaxID=39966 RepID=A0A369JNW2_HYPMA|nr:hypothetical protein Hypma_003613 [Hypsizygus marmoreus]RDB23558.1 hypothetical protein Hypma_008881 [Hypsizygus marmoreus]
MVVSTCYLNGLRILVYTSEPETNPSLQALLYQLDDIDAILKSFVSIADDAYRAFPMMMASPLQTTGLALGLD